MTSMRLASTVATLVLTVGTAVPGQVPAGKPAVEQTAAELRTAAQRALQGQRFAEAEGPARKLVEKSNLGSDWSLLGIVLHQEKKYDEALACHKKAAELGPGETTAVGSYNAACVYAIQGQADDAFAWLGKSLAAGFDDFGTIAADPDMDNLRKDPRFAKVLQRVKEGGGAEPEAKAAGDGLPAGEMSWSNEAPRMGTRLAFFGQASSSGQVAIDYGTAAWKDEYEQAMNGEEVVNRRWRLGQEFWTTLDTSLPVTIGSVRLEPGAYYLTVEKKQDGRFVLAFLDPAQVRKAHIDPFVAHLTKGGQETEMKYEKVADKADKLHIVLSSAGEQSASGTLTITFGPHRLTAPVRCHIES